MSSSSRLGGHPAVARDDEAIYQYALKAAIHQDLSSLAPPAASTSTSTASQPQQQLAGATVVASASATTKQEWSLTDVFKLSSQPAQKGHRPGMSSTALPSFVPSAPTRKFLGGGSSSTDDGGGTRFPKEMLKALGARMSSLLGHSASGSAGGALSPLERTTLQAFYSGPWASSDFQKRVKASRKLEDLTASFIPVATPLVKKHLANQPSTSERPPGAEEAQEIMRQTARFVRIIKETLESPSVRPLTPHDVLLRVDKILATLAPSPGPASTPRRGGNDGGAAAAEGQSYGGKLEEMPNVRLVGTLFGKDNGELLRDVAALKRSCTDKAMFRDLKLLINSLAQQSPNSTSSPHLLFASPSDFQTVEAYTAWKKQESDKLSGRIVEMTMRDVELLKTDLVDVRGAGGSDPPERVASPMAAQPGLSKRSSFLGPSSGGAISPTLMSPSGSLSGLPGRNASFAGLSQIRQQDEDDTASMISAASSSGPDPLGQLTFIPPDPRFYYRRMFEIALDYAYTRVKSGLAGPDVPVSILGSDVELLLDTLGETWRVWEPTKRVTRLAMVVRRFRDGEVPEESVVDALDKVEQEGRREEPGRGYDGWTNGERLSLFKTSQTLLYAVLSLLFQIFQGIVESSFGGAMDLLHLVSTNPVYKDLSPYSTTLLPGTPALDVTLGELEMGMKKYVRMAYEEKQVDLDSSPDRPHDLWTFLEMLDWINLSVRRYLKALKGERILGRIDVPKLWVGVVAPEFVRHLDACKTALFASASQAEGAASDQDLLHLYNGIIKLQSMHDELNPETKLVIDFSAWFEPYVRRWLVTTETKTSDWVRNAISHDKFVAEEGAADKHSTSVIDLIESCKSATDFILNLNWPDEVQNAKYLTKLSSIISKSIEQYCTHLEQMFMYEMFPMRQAAQEQAAEDASRPSAWITKAKMAVQGDKKIEAFVFKPETCVKLNNIQAARGLVSSMYERLNADAVSRLVEENTPIAFPETTQQQRYLFTVKIVLGENLRSLEGGAAKLLDPFLILSDSKGQRVAKTRTMYETQNPRWEETIDVSVKGDLWLRATVWNRKLVDQHDMAGLAYIHLNPAEYGDFLARDVWLGLEDKNEKKIEGSRLLFRISMEGEKDDILFYFGRAGRFLKRAESDMARTIVDKMSPFIRHYISRNSVKNVLKRPGFDYDFDFEQLKPNLDQVKGNLNRVAGRVNMFVRDAMGNIDETIPPVPSHWDRHNDGDHSHTPGNVSPGGPNVAGTQASLQKKKAKHILTEIEIENSISDLWDYFNETFSVLWESLSHEAWELVSLRLWKEILLQFENILVPPLSDQPTDMKPLAEKELQIVFTWLKAALNFFNDEGKGVPLEDLCNAKYRELIEANLYYHESTDFLMEEHVQRLKQFLMQRSDSLLGRSKSVLHQRNLGAIRHRKTIKKQTQGSSGEIILRILRMRPGTQDFLVDQISTMMKMQAEQAKQGNRATTGSLQRRTGAAREGVRGRNRMSRNMGRTGGAAPASTYSSSLPTVNDEGPSRQETLQPPSAPYAQPSGAGHPPMPSPALPLASPYMQHTSLPIYSPPPSTAVLPTPETLIGYHAHPPAQNQRAPSPYAQQSQYFSHQPAPGPDYH